MAKFIPRLFTASEPATTPTGEMDVAATATSGVSTRTGRHAAPAPAVPGAIRRTAPASAPVPVSPAAAAPTTASTPTSAPSPSHTQRLDGLTGHHAASQPSTQPESLSGALPVSVDESTPPHESAPPREPAQAEARATRTVAPTVAPAHPSAPIPVLGDGVGADIRNTVGQSDLSVFPVSLGTSVFGWTAETAASEAILNRYADFGGNFIDTADSYSGGRSEHIIGRWMSKRHNRDDMVVATKIGRHPDSPGLGPVNMVRAVEASLERLATDHIDLLYFHDDDDSVRLEDALGTAQWLIETGKVRYLGVSNFRPERLVEARILTAAGYPRFEAIETHYSLMAREAYEGDLQMVVQGQQLGVMPYYALENGFLTGKYRSRADFADRHRSAKAAEHLGRRGLRVLKALDAIALELGVSVTTVAIAWLLHRPGVAAPVVSASRPEQVDAIVQAAGVQLTRTHVLDLERASRR